RGKSVKSNLSLLEGSQVDELMAHYGASGKPAAAASSIESADKAKAASHVVRPVLRSSPGGVVRVAPAKPKTALRKPEEEGGVASGQSDGATPAAPAKPSSPSGVTINDRPDKAPVPPQAPPA